MSKKASVVIIIALMLLGVATVSAQTEPIQPEPIDVDSVAGEPVPVALPDDDLRRVLVAVVGISTEGDRPVGELISTEEFSSYAPKVFARAGGDWVVRLDSTPAREFFVFDPRYAETETKDREALTWVKRSEPVVLELVIPLYEGSERLEFGTVTIVDLATETVVITFER